MDACLPTQDSSMTICDTDTEPQHTMCMLSCSKGLRIDLDLPVGDLHLKKKHFQQLCVHISFHFTVVSRLSGNCSKCGVQWDCSMNLVASGF